MLSRLLKTSRGKLDLGDLRQICSRFGLYTREQSRLLSASLAAAIAALLMQLAAPWPIKVIFDYVLSERMAGTWAARLLGAVSSSPIGALGWICAAILAVAVLEGVFCYWRDVGLATIGQRVVGNIRRDLFAHLQTLPPSVFEQRKTGALLTRLTGDIQLLRQMLVNAIVTAAESALMIIAVTLIMLWLNWQLTLLSLAVLPLTFVASWRVARQIRVATKKQREKESEVASIAHDVFGAMAIVQAFNREEIENKRFRRENRSSVRAGVKTTRLESRLYRLITFASSAGLCTILYFGVRAILADPPLMTAGDLLVFISYVRMVNKPARNLSKLTSRLAKSTACGQRVGELFELQPDVTDRPDAIPMRAVRGDVRFDGVHFAYEADRPALANVDLSVAAGERIAIVGPTGAGKTTLFKLMLRFHDPDGGAVFIDGHDLRGVTTESLRRSIGWAHQDSVLFGMSIRDNIALGAPEADDNAIRAVAARVRADEFIEPLPNGYDTVLGSQGATLSGGQRQRLALARALLRDPRILLLDEPATGLDALTRAVVEESWLSAANKATTFVICHRVSNMGRFDRVVLLSNGRIVAQGPHDDLLRDCPDYAALVEAARGIPLRLTRERA